MAKSRRAGKRIRLRFKCSKGVARPPQDWAAPDNARAKASVFFTAPGEPLPLFSVSPTGGMERREGARGLRGPIGQALAIGPAARLARARARTDRGLRPPGAPSETRVVGAPGSCPLHRALEMAPRMSRTEIGLYSLALKVKSFSRPRGEERRKRVSNHEAASSFETRPTAAPQDKAEKCRARHRACRPLACAAPSSTARCSRSRPN